MALRSGVVTWFLMVKQGGGDAPASIVVVQNWGEELKRLLPNGR